MPAEYTRKKASNVNICDKSRALDRRADEAYSYVNSLVASIPNIAASAISVSTFGITVAASASKLISL
jgi:hypothetical protein